MKIDTTRIEALAREVAAREAGRAGDRRRALELAESLHREVGAALGRFAVEVRQAGAPHLDLIRVGPVEPDDKSVRAFQFRIGRGRLEAIVVSKDRGEVMLVGPFKRGQDEGPCRPIHLDEGGPAAARLEESLESLLVDFVKLSFGK